MLNNKYQPFISIIIISFATLNIIFLIWYVFYGYQSWFHSDSAAQLLLAVESIKNGDYFVRDWNYANGDIWALYNNIFLIPSVLIGGEGYFSFALSRIIPSILVLLGSYLVATLVAKSRSAAVLTASIVAGGISPWMAENLYGQISYGTYYYTSCFLIFFSWKYMESMKSKIDFWLIGIAVITFLSFWSNPNRAVMIYVIPLLISLITAYGLDSRIETSEKYYKLNYLAGTLLVFALIGYVFYINTLKLLNPPTGLDLKWLSFPEILDNFGHTIHGIFGIFGSIPEANQKVISANGFYAAFRILMALILLFILPYTIYRGFLHKDRSITFLTSFSTYSLFIVLFFQLTTNLPNMDYPVSVSRYLVPSVLLIVILFASTLHNLFLERKYKIFLAGLFAISILTTSGYYALVRNSLNFEENKILPRLKQNPHAGLASFLIKNDLHYGYATFWRAGVISVLSSGNVKIRQIVFHKGLPIPMRWLSSDNWYEPEHWRGKTFLATSNDEESQLDLGKLERKLDQSPIRVLTFEDKKIYIFGGNALANLSGWSLNFSSGYTFYPDNNSFKQIGIVQTSQRNNRQEIVAHKGEVGFLHYGPYVNVEPGNYKITFDIEVLDAKKKSVRLDVSASSGAKILGELELPSSNSNPEIYIKVDKREVLEFRVFSYGKSNVIFKSVSIKKQ